jgi:2-oxo-4-hydroxy-4-carboxy--5-ureidoimidazoline (OHCU) decarboxylase
MSTDEEDDIEAGFEASIQAGSDGEEDESLEEVFKVSRDLLRRLLA